MTRGLLLAFAAAVLATAVAVPAQAQGPEAREGRQRMGQMNERMLQSLFDGIELTAEQQARVRAITEHFAPRIRTMREEMMAARQSGQTLSPEQRQAMQALNREQRDSLRTVMTAEQQATFDRNAQQTMQRRPPGERQRAAAWRERDQRARTRIS